MWADKKAYEAKSKYAEQDTWSTDYYNKAWRQQNKQATLKRNEPNR